MCRSDIRFPPSSQPFNTRCILIKISRKSSPLATSFPAPANVVTGPGRKSSLLQLSTPTVCYLFRLNRIPLAKPILQLLESSDVLKIGADVAGDLRSLRQIRHFRDGGFVDLQALAPQWGIGEKSLRKLSAIVLGQRVSKAQRLSNWEAATLTDKQQLYAATDAWVCIRIYEQLLRTPKKPIRK